MYDFILIDFDSTLIKLESLEELAKFALENNPKKDFIAKELEHITNLGMEGKIPFNESLEMRLKLFSSHKSILDKVADYLLENITPSFLNNIDFLRNNKDRIIIVSGGFKELIIPIVEALGLKTENIFANTFIYDDLGNIIGVDQSNYLSQEKGKVKQVAALNLAGNVVAIGDGYTDYQIKEAGLASKFFAFTEIISREKVIEVADEVLNSFDEFIDLYHKTIKVEIPVLESYDSRG